MASISSVITGGFGAPGSAALVITDGYGQAADVYLPPVIVSANPSGVRRPRFLRRGPRLPWEEEDVAEVVRVVDPPKRKRIKLPREVIETVQDSMPVQAYVEVSLPRIIIPDIPVQLPDDDDDDLLLML